MEEDFEIEEDALEEVEVTENENMEGEVDEDEGEDVEVDEEMSISENDDVHFTVENDMAKYTFDGHTDFVYSVAIHPTIPGLVATGNELFVSSVFFYV